MIRSNTSKLTKNIYPFFRFPKFPFRKSTYLFAFGVAGLLSVVYGPELVHQPPAQLGSFPVVVPTVKYGFALDTFQVTEGNIGQNDILSDILVAHHVDFNKVQEIVTNARNTFDFGSIRAGKPYTVLAKDTSAMADFFIYEPDIRRYVLVDVANASTRIVERPTSTNIGMASGTVESTLWDALGDNGLSNDLASKMEEALKCAVDFHHVREGDQFKLVYEQQLVEGRPAGSGQLLGAYFKQGGKDYFGIYFDNGKVKGYYDLEGRPMKKGFLKAPLKFANISSSFSHARLHPILKYVRPHFGTDYAAPRGTPILAVADGVVEKAEFQGGNGNYVKIRHDKVYETQYLHMQGFARGVRRGSRVQQGQVIGYVGATGLATGPHVCFRFWKNGQQVNHLREKLPRPQPMEKKDLQQFFPVRDDMVAKINAIPFRSSDEIAEEKLKTIKVSSKANP